MKNAIYVVSLANDHLLPPVRLMDRLATAMLDGASNTRLAIDGVLTFCDPRQSVNHSSLCAKHFCISASSMASMADDDPTARHKQRTREYGGAEIAFARLPNLLVRACRGCWPISTQGRVLGVSTLRYFSWRMRAVATATKRHFAGGQVDAQQAWPR